MLGSLYVYRARVITVVDGDTLDLDVDLGFETTRRIRVRLLGLNCPEMDTPEGKAAKAYVQTWALSNSTVLVHTVKDRREKYGRYLATITPEGIGRSLNQALLDDRMAVPYA